jgi:hypothetical protein
VPAAAGDSEVRVRDRKALELAIAAIMVAASMHVFQSEASLSARAAFVVATLCCAALGRLSAHIDD